MNVQYSHTSALMQYKARVVPLIHPHNTVNNNNVIPQELCVIMCRCNSVSVLQAVPELDASPAAPRGADALFRGYVTVGHTPQTLPRGPLPQHH